MRMGYTDPLRGMERSMNPEYAQRQMRDPGLRSITPHMGSGLRPRMSGLGSLHHTMPHLRNLSGTQHFQVGGLSNPVAQVLGAGTYAPANVYAPDPQYRSFLSLIDAQSQMRNPDLTRPPSLSPGFMYQTGGEVDADPQDLGSPDQEMSPQEQQQKQIVLNAMAALEGQSPDPEADMKAFIDAFGPRALADLQQLVESKHEEERGDEGDEGEEGEEGEPGEDEDEEESAASDMAGAGGGLLHGRGTGQSDEIEGATPTGRPVLLSDGEYVVDAGTVAALGDGSTKAGARRLDEMRKQIRTKAYGHDKQVKPMAKGGGATVVLRLK